MALYRKRGDFNTPYSSFGVLFLSSGAPQGAERERREPMGRWVGALNGRSQAFSTSRKSGLIYRREVR